MGALGVSRQSGLVSPSYGVYRPIDGSALRNEYVHHLVRTPQYVSEYIARSTGIHSSRLRLYPDQFLRIPLVYPPGDEQAAIVRFLNYANRRIERAIQTKKKLIALLNEQKQVIIHRAMTRGLDLDACLKPSGIPWLGDIPAHWDVLPFVRCAIERADYRGATPEKVEAGVFLVTAKNIRQGWIDYESSREYVRVDQYSRIMRRGLPKRGDVLLTTEAPLGHVALVDREDIALAQRIIRFRLDPSRLRSDFALYSLTSRYFQDQLQMRATGSTAQGIKASKLPQLLLVFPSTDEQERILNWLRPALEPLAGSRSPNWIASATS